MFGGLFQIPGDNRYLGGLFHTLRGCLQGIAAEPARYPSSHRNVSTSLALSEISGIYYVEKHNTSSSFHLSEGRKGGKFQVPGGQTSSTRHNPRTHS